MNVLLMCLVFVCFIVVYNSMEDRRGHAPLNGQIALLALVVLAAVFIILVM